MNDEADFEEPPTDTLPLSLTGVRFSREDDLEINRRVEAELRTRYRMKELVDEAEPEVDTGPTEIIGGVRVADLEEAVKKKAGNTPLYEERRHWFELVPLFGAFIMSIVFSLVLVGVAIWFRVAPPVFTAPPHQGGDSAIADQLTDGIYIVLNGIVKALQQLFVTLEPFAPWFILAFMIAGIAWSIFRGFRDFLLWCFTWYVLTEENFAIIVRLPKGRILQPLLALVKIEPDSKQMPRAFIGNPAFSQGFFGLIFRFGRAKLESAAQFDQEFQDIRHIRKFKKFQEELDPMHEFATQT